MIKKESYTRLSKLLITVILIFSVSRVAYAKDGDIYNASNVNLGSIRNIILTNHIFDLMENIKTYGYEIEGKIYNASDVNDVFNKNLNETVETIQSSVKANLTPKCNVPIETISSVQAVSAINGIVTVTFNNILASVPTLVDFAVTQTIGTAATITVLSTEVKMDSTMKIATLTVPLVAATTEDQSVVYGVSYKNTTTVNSMAFGVDSNWLPREEDSYFWKQMPTEEDVANDKTWTIPFSEPLDKSSVNKRTIYVREDTWRVVETKLSMSEDGKQVSITPVNKYIPGHPYYLFITSGENGVRYVRGYTYAEQRFMIFTVKSDAIKIDKTFNNQTITLKKGDVFQLELPAWGVDGGYRWKPIQPIDSNMLKTVDDTYIRDHYFPGIVGENNGRQRWMIEATENGEKTINLALCRSVEDEEYIDNFNVKVIVK